MSMLNVIEFSGSSNHKWLIYKHPNNEFNTKSKLIVRQGQVAVVVYGGKVEGLFENGTFELDNVNFPFLSTLQKNVFGGSAPFIMDVYFINRTMKLDMFWGTKDPIQLLDPKFNVKINLRARAQYGLRIKNYGFLITELFGALKADQMVDFDVINNFFRSVINTRIKSLLAKEITEKQISILDVNIYLEELSEESHKRLRPDFEKFGMELINFYYESINIPDTDLEKINEFLNKRAEFDILGDSRYRTSRGFDVLDSAASNEGGAGGLASAGLGLGVGVGIAKESINLTEDIKQKEETKQCISCNATIKANQKFCSECGSQQEIKCHNCNAVLTKKSKFCPECGTTLEKEGK